MSECGPAYPEYLTRRDRNNSVRPWSTDHKSERYIAQQNCIRISSLPQILEMGCPGLSTREWPLLVTCGHWMARNATFTK